MDKAPLVIVWPCRLSVAEYAAAGKRVAVPEQACPRCGARLHGWSGYHLRWLRHDGEHRIFVRRGRCARCRATHTLLPDFVHARRLDAVEVIGTALEAMHAGEGMRRVAGRLGLPHATVRDWRRRHRAGTSAPRAPRGARDRGRRGLARAARRRRGGGAPRARGALGAGPPAVRRSGAGPWRLWNLVCGGEALGTNRGAPLADPEPAGSMG